ncbi:MAG: hypothetical protein LC107_06275 [Chitinophagales bacterium]|nr:hypothetical protein [Chitinophagales bacterium]
MTLEQKIKKLKSLDYPIDTFTVDEINRHYDRVEGMNITESVKTFGRHPHANDYRAGEIDVELLD